ncbi:hypothetical protein O7627_19485 [Solwaraspora sp. WMMD1047]|uniref:hypothetical protein n=1 Tax=Solwaraspora sp. WMMD1047 TaxID=3016102 RepID=UPI0024169CA5|nr:hypothetical protein [Solwaraspora sp. WMMD1047]MDG4831484.1 hypothetical protein [Solwaraspora sp. WMMD1047]
MTAREWHTVRRPGRLDGPARLALALGLAGLGYRVALTLLTVPATNSDEATFGLAALHIANGREFPVLLYGQQYMGVLESYLAAPLFAVFGAGWRLLRLPLLLLWALFGYLTYRLTRRLYSPWLAAVTVGLLALGSERVIRDQLTAVGGRPEIKAAVAGLLLLALWLARRRGRHRLLGFAGYGLLTGLCVWSDWLALPYLATVGLVLLAGCGRELFGRAGLALVTGFLVGVAPLVVANLTAPPGEDSLTVLLTVSGGEPAEPSLSARLRGAVLLGIPLATGVCTPQRCGGAAQSWGVLYLLLVAAAIGLAVAGLRRHRTDRLRYAGQLALAAAAALTIAGYARSPYAAQAPLESARYLSILQISLPAVLWPVWLAARPTRQRGGAPPDQRPGGDRPDRRRVLAVPAVGLLALLTVACVLTSAALVARIGEIRAEERRARELADTVRAAGLRHVYAEYWICNRLTFTTREEVVCAVLDDRLRAGQDRYLPYRWRVWAAERPGFVFVAGAPGEAALRTYLRDRDIAATVTEVAGYRIYRPASTVQPWR